MQLLVNDLVDKVEVSRYDFLIFRPPTFNLTLRVPKVRAVRNSSFEVLLLDTSKTYKFYLSHFVLRDANSGLETGRGGIQEVHASEWLVIVAIISVTLLSFLLLHLAAIFLHVTGSDSTARHEEPQCGTSSYMPCQRYYKENVYSGSVATDVIANSPISHCRRTRCQCAFIILYIVFKVFYSLLITFTAALSLLNLVLHNDISTLSKLSVFHTQKYDDTINMANDIYRYAGHELRRQDEIAFNTNKACKEYLTHQFDSIFYKVLNSTEHSNAAHSLLSPYLTDIFALKVNDFHKDIESYTSDIRSNFTSSLKPVMHNYIKYLKKVFDNEWMLYTQFLFNRSEYSKMRPKTFRTVYLSGKEVDFGAFLPVEEVEHVQLWALNWWERYRISLPRMPSISQLWSESPNIPCGTLFKRDNKTSKQKLLLRYQHANSTRFFTLDAYDNNNKRSRTKYVHDLSLPQRVHNLSDIIDEYWDYMDIQTVWKVFLLLDAVMLLYRISHIIFNTRLLLYGFEDYVFIGEKGKFVNDDEKPEAQAHDKLGLNHTECYHNNISSAEIYMTNIDEKIEFLSALPNAERARTRAKPNISTFDKFTPSDSYGFNIYPGETCTKTTALDYIQSPTVPKVVLGLVVLVQVIFINELVSVMLSAEILYDLDGFKIFLVGLDVQINKTNWHLEDQARYYNDFLLGSYRGHLNSELVHFQQLVQYFNTGNHTEIYFPSDLFVENNCRLHYHLKQ